METLKLTSSWDLTLDGNGNLAVATGGAALAQDVASAISTFLGEVYYDTTQGVPWLSQVFGEAFSPSLVKALLEKAALTVPGVVKASAVDLAFTSGVITGLVRIVDTAGQSLDIAF